MPRPELAPEEILAILSTSIERVRRITEGISEGQLDWTGTDKDWSIRYIVAHLRAAEDALGGQMMRIVAEDRPRWRRLSPREYIRRTDYPQWQVTPALDAFHEHRAMLMGVIAELPLEAWERTAVVTHARGKVVDRTLRFYGNWLATHERDHLDQIKEMAAASTGRISDR